MATSWALSAVSSAMISATSLSLYCAAAQELYFSCIPIPLVYPPSGPYDSMDDLNASLPPSCGRWSAKRRETLRLADLHLLELIV